MIIVSTAIPFLVCVLVYFVYFVPFFVLFVHRRNLEPIHSRGWELSIVSNVAGFLFFNVIAIETFITHNNMEISCHFLYWPTCFFVGIFTIPYFLRCAMLYTKYKYNTSKLHDSPSLVWMRRNKLFSSTRFQLGVLAATFVISVIIAACIQFTPGVDFPPNTSKHCLDRAIFILIPQVALVVVLYVVSVVVTWGVNDAFEIKTELKVLTVIIPLLFVPFAIRTASTILTPYVDGSYFSLPIIAISFTVSIVFPVIMSYKLQRSRFQKFNMAAYTEDFNDMVNNLGSLFRFVMETPLLRKEFQKFCVESWCVENLLFYRDVTEYEQLDTVEARRHAAKKIVSLYIGIDTPRQINIDMKAEIAVRDGMATGEFNPDLFGLALAQVETQMKQDTLSHWKQTSNFKAALNKVRVTGEFPLTHITTSNLESLLLQDP